MLKLKRLLFLAAALVAVGLFVPACLESPEDDPHKVVVINAGTDGGAAVAGEDDNYLATTFAFPGEIVYLDYGLIPADKDGFDRWTSTPPVTFHVWAQYPKISYFTMPRGDITVTAHWIDDGAEEYAVVVVSAGAGAGGGGPYYEDDVVSINAGKAPLGQIFNNWTAVPNIIDFDNDTDSATTFVMPDRPVTVTASFVSDGWAYVRFTWEAAEEENINYIIASEGDVATWLNDVYLDLDAEWSDEDFTDEPKFFGSPSLPNNVFSYGTVSAHKSVYYSIDDLNEEDGWYTAVASVYDELFDSDAFIVANYRVSLDNDARYDFDAKRWFEVAFDVGTFLAGEDDLGWFDDAYTNPDTDPRLKKGRGGRRSAMRKVYTRKVVNAYGAFEVDYFVIRTRRG
ncbi:MAG: hypothetical protein LBC70_09870 [Chitinispirillales bacterium]|jgi:hypothetical protein|nr:hypothetical protein [Chitinispirillales bacterium]